ncbi:MAG: PGF-CTERM sorting domain-containing protein [Methanothrix sp.]|nr:PGF-CTERM sorting domain-containing protein [Methanothrix sp.]
MKKVGKLVIRDMKILYLILMAVLFAMISNAAAQNPLEAAAGSLQEQVNAAGQQIQQKAIEHALDGNLTQEHIAQDLNATKDNLTAQATAKINQISQNLTPEQLQQKATEELKKQVSEQIKQQPGFEAALGILATLAAFGLLRRRN